MDLCDKIGNILKCHSGTEAPGTPEETYLDMVPLLNSTKDNKNNLLINYWLQKSFENFLEEAKKQKEDLGRVYKEHDNYCILELVTRSIGNEVYLNALIDAGVDLNRKNQKTGEVVLHQAAEDARFETVKILLNSKECDPNVQNFEGDTPLHKLLLKWDKNRPKSEETLQLLLNHKHIAVNVPNLRGLTPIYIAAKQDEEKIMAELLKFASTFDLDTFQSLTEKKTAREIIADIFPGLEKEFPEWKPDLSKEGSGGTQPLKDYKYQLFYYLHSGDETKFCQILEEVYMKYPKNMVQLLSSLDGRSYTYLQCAAKYGQITACEALVQHGVDVNSAAEDTEPPITLALSGKNNNILSLLLKNGGDTKTDKDGENLLHKAVKLTDSNTQIETLTILFEETMIGVNDPDNSGRTPLHLAVAKANERVIYFLIDKGAKLDVVNNSGEMPLKQISLPTLKKYFDNKITTNNESHNDQKFCYIFDYNFFKPYNNTTSLLKHFKSSKELRTLLVHPILSTAILLKWYKVRLFFYLNLFFFTLFGLSLTLSIFYGPVLHNSTCYANETNQTIGDSYVNTTNSGINTGCHNQLYFKIMQSFILLFASVLAASELYQFIRSPKEYFKNIENWIQIGVFVSIYTLVGTGCLKNSNPNSYCNDISAIALFFAWFEFFFVMGQHPNTTSYVGMFRTAAVFLIKFLAVHTCLILAFVFSFHVLLKKSPGSSFSTIPDSFFKTIIMITGEHDIGIDPQDLPYTAYFLFYAFIFLVAIVLFNLLIGFAVSATRPIQKDPFLYSCMGQVSIISFFENTFFNNAHCINKLLNYFVKPKDIFDSHSIFFIYPNDKNKIEVIKKCEKKDETKVILKYPITYKIVEDTRRMINHKVDENLKLDKFEEIKNRVDATNAKLDDQLKNVRTSLSELFEKIDKLNVTEAVQNAVLTKKKMKSERVKSMFLFKSSKGVSKDSKN